MSSWAKSSGTGRRPQTTPNGSQTHRSFRRPAPYPTREDRTEEHKDILKSYEELEQQHKYSSNMQFEGYQRPPNTKTEGYSPTDRRKALYQRFYRQVQDEKEPADCVVLSITNQCMDYPKSLGECLQERGLSVEMLYLQAESGLTRALQDIRADGSPLCILVEHTNVALSSCTVIIFSESLKIHRNMPKDQAMDFVAAEYNRGLVKERPPKEPADMAARASQLLSDFLDRQKVERHAVPSDTRQLLLLLAEGVHLYPEELATVSQYLRSRQDHMQASTTDGKRGNMLPPGLGKPPPLLPTPPSAPLTLPGPGGPLAGPAGEPQPGPLLSPSGSYPKTKPPPLLSLHRAPGPHGPPHGPPHGTHLGPAPPRGPPSLHSPYNGPRPHGPPHNHVPQYYQGPRGSAHGARGGPPSLKSLRPHTPLMPVPGGPNIRSSGPRR
ncbi:nuclear receptor coactivator 5 isoform X1 [Gadus morhua]|uniref:nuclear receptor coactivator 5 isoform X1 n=1 Tax=Gadus morhua TaxID=8049 RepID=UPI0011B39855|nr:nuclear receptor coactivator 5-like isoform X1 [Gadus morhua]